LGCTVFEIETRRPPFYNETHHISFDGGLSYVDDHYKRRQYPSIENLRFGSIILGCWKRQHASMKKWHRS
jgi:hypothetical protein